MIVVQKALIMLKLKVNVWFKKFLIFIFKNILDKKLQQKAENLDNKLVYTNYKPIFKTTTEKVITLITETIKLSNLNNLLNSINKDDYFAKQNERKMLHRKHKTIADKVSYIFYKV